MSRCLFLGLCLIFTGASFSPDAEAQGLIWNAPPEGTEVQFEGDYIQEDERPQEVNQKIQLEWRRRLWIKALKKIQAEYNGQMVDCQWFEMKVVTGTETGDGELVPGPGGQRIYKILVPLERATLGPPMGGNVVDKQGIPIGYLPIVKGYRRIDEQAAEPITSGVFHAHAGLTLLTNYRTLEAVTEEDPQVKYTENDTAQTVATAMRYHGELVMESPTNRTTNKADIWANDSSPFGLVRWKVEVARETKDGKASRDQFQLTSTYRVDMKLVKKSMDAVSDLAEE